MQPAHLARWLVFPKYSSFAVVVRHRPRGSRLLAFFPSPSCSSWEGEPLVEGIATEEVGRWGGGGIATEEG